MFRKIIGIGILILLCTTVLTTTYYTMYFRPYQSNIDDQISKSTKLLNENTIDRFAQKISDNDKYYVSRALLENNLLKNQQMRQIYYSLHFFCWHEIISFLYSKQEIALLFMYPSSGINLFESSQLLFNKSVDDLSDEEIEGLINRVKHPGKYRNQ